MQRQTLARAFASLLGATFLLYLAGAGRAGAQEDVSDFDPIEESYMVYNVAAAANGATITASSTLSVGYPPESLINGDRKGVGWGTGTGGWQDATRGVFPDTVEIQFPAEMSITEIDIVTIQDNYPSPVEPTLDMTFSEYGVRDFNVWYRGTDGLWYMLWSVTGNNKVLRHHRFTPVMTDRVKVEVLNSPASWHNQVYSRLVEVEVWGNAGLELMTEPLEEPPAPGPTATPVCVPDGDPPNGRDDGIDLCASLRNLLSAMNGNRSGPLPYGKHITDTSSLYYRNQFWTDNLKWNYSPWRTNGSQNIPVSTHALALWRAPSDYGRLNDTEALNWWINYLDCQTGNPCNVTDPQELQYFKSSELFSNTYDTHTVGAIIATHVWAAREYPSIPNSTRREKVKAVLDKSRAYLQMNWRLYALGAGKGAAKVFRNRYNYSDGLNPFNNTKAQVCHKRYTGPFIPVAGMRSTIMHACLDDRGPLLARVLGWLHQGPGVGKHLRDILVRAEEFKAAANQMPGALYTNESAYALTSALRGMLRRHINGTPLAGEDTTTAIFNALRNVRPGAAFHFIGARTGFGSGDEARLTLMEDNLTQETAATFALTYDFQQRLARALFPWPNRGVNPQVCTNSRSSMPGKAWRRTVTRGYANLLPTDNSPTQLFGHSSNRDGMTDCKNHENGVPITETFSIPGDWAIYYHIKFNPNGPPVRLR
jgi:hypothetical protein